MADQPAPVGLSKRFEQVDVPENWKVLPFQSEPYGSTFRHGVDHASEGGITIFDEVAEPEHTSSSAYNDLAYAEEDMRAEVFILLGKAASGKTRWAEKMSLIEIYSEYSLARLGAPSRFAFSGVHKCTNVTEALYLTTKAMSAHLPVKAHVLMFEGGTADALATDVILDVAGWHDGHVRD